MLLFDELETVYNGTYCVFLVFYKAMLLDGSIVAETPEEGIDFYVKDGILCFINLYFIPCRNSNQDSYVLTLFTFFRPFMPSIDQST